MPYNKQKFVAGQTLKADHLNAIEDQIALNEENIGSLNEAIADKADLIEVTDTTTGEKKKAVLSVEDGILVVREV